MELRTTAQTGVDTLISAIINSHRSELVDQWKENIRRTDPAGAEHLLNRLSQEVENGQDLLSLLQGFPSTQAGASDERLAPLFDKVRTVECTLANFFTEVQSLSLAFEAVLPRSAELKRGDVEAVLSTIRLRLNQTFKRVMERTGSVYEHVVETGPHAVCEIDREGKILCANAAMRDLIAGAVPGRLLAEFFTGADKNFVVEAARGGATNGVVAREFDLTRPDQTSKRVRLSIQPLVVSGQRVGAYATAIDISYIVGRQERFLDLLEMPAIKLNQDLVVTYSNPATVKLLGCDADLRGKSIFELFPHTRVMSDQFSRRRQGKGDVYETEMVRPSDHKMIPVCVAGTPILDDQGNYLGTLGIIRSLERERAAAAIETLIHTERDDTALLTALAQLLQTLVPFDCFTVSQYSQSSDHVSLWFNYTSGEQIIIGRRWWPISPEMKKFTIQARSVADVEEFIRTHQPTLLEDPHVKRFLSQGFRSTLRIPIRQQDRIVAAVALLRKEAPQVPPYCDADLELLLSLPVEQAVRMAFYYKRRRDDQFRHELFREMFRCRTARPLAELLVEGLVKHYEWDHVTVAKACKGENVFQILAAASAPGKPGISPKDCRWPLAEGVSGYVYRTGTIVNIPDLQKHELRRKFVRTWEGTQSELCLPIVWDGEVQWILDVEDDRADAFSKDEEQEVAAFLDEAGLILGKISRQYLLESTLESTSDVILATDTQSTIVAANPAAAKLLGYDSPGALLGPFERVFKDTRTAQVTFATTGSAATEVEWVRKDGSTVPVLLSGSDLPEDLFRKIFVGTDLTVARRLESLESLQELFQEIAIQTHTPLALIETWVRRAARENPDTDLYYRILAQLKKLEISYDRLALSVECGNVLRAAQPQPLDLGVEIKRTKEEFPELDQRAIRYDDPGELPYVQADPGQLAFVFASILAYLTRLCPGENHIAEEDKVRVGIEQAGETLNVVFSIRAPLSPDLTGGDRSLARARFELALGEPTIRAFVAANDATYERALDTTGITIRLGFTIPRR